MAAKAKNVGAFLQPSQTSKMEHFVKIVNGIKLLTIFTKAPS